jgi:hypothetical protein
MRATIALVLFLSNKTMKQFIITFICVLFSVFLLSSTGVITINTPSLERHLTDQNGHNWKYNFRIIELAGKPYWYSLRTDDYINGQNDHELVIFPAVIDSTFLSYLYDVQYINPKFILQSTECNR